MRLHFRLTFLKCVVLIKPTTENVTLLSREISDPRFGSYFVYFTNRVRRSDLKSLAEMDCHEVIADIKEIASDFLVLESHLFLASGVSQPIKNLVSGQVLVLEILDLGSILCYAKMF